jgi:hypothetical protein
MEILWFGETAHATVEQWVIAIDRNSSERHSICGRQDPTDMSAGSATGRQMSRSELVTNDYESAAQAIDPTLVRRVASA